MDITNMKTLIKKNIIDFSELVLNNYHKIGLDETDAIILIKLQYLLKKNITFISAARLSDMLSISPRTTAKRLNKLIESGFIRMELITGNNGKETESFNLDYLVERILLNDYEEQEALNKSNGLSVEAKIVKLFEEEFNKPLSVLDIQTITKWLNEDHYTFEEIQDALFESIKMRKLSIKYVDGILLKSEEIDPGQMKKRKAIVSDLRKIWEE